MQFLTTVCSQDGGMVPCIQDVAFEERVGSQIDYKPADVYDGQYDMLQMRHGEGSLSGSGGDKYFGQFQRNQAHGHGVLNLPGGAVYDGGFDSDKASGPGVFTHVDGTTYSGQWLHDNPHGLGEEHFVDGSTFRGTFEAGMKQGPGEYRLADGSVFEGELRENNIHGLGQMRFADGRIYHGQWRHNHISGLGEMRWPDGSHYVGGYYDNMKHGSGRYEWPNGSFFEGEWRSGVQHGLGVFGVADGTAKQRIGIWDDGQRSSWIDPDRDQNVFVDNVPRKVNLAKENPEDKFGFMFSTPKGDMSHLLVSRIIEGGKLHRWNSERAYCGAFDDVVDLNARIVGVNGVTGNGDAMKGELQKPSVQLDVLNPINRRLKFAARLPNAAG